MSLFHHSCIFQVLSWGAKLFSAIFSPIMGDMLNHSTVLLWGSSSVFLINWCSSNTMDRQCFEAFNMVFFQNINSILLRYCLPILSNAKHIPFNYYKSISEFPLRPTSLWWTHLNTALKCLYHFVPIIAALLLGFCLRGCLSMKIKRCFKFGWSLPSLCLYSFTSGDYLHLQISVSCFALVFVLVPRISSFLHLISPQAFLKLFTSLLQGPTFRFIIPAAVIHSSAPLLEW